MQTLLAIAGTDPTSGAGVTADIQVFADFGYHGLWVPTAVIDQDTASVHEIHPLAPDVVERMIRRVLRGGAPAGIKIGVLFSAEVALGVARALEEVAGEVPVVVDPVLSSGLGGELSQVDLVDALRRRVLPLTTVLTPNVPEAERLSGRTVADLDAACDVARELSAMGPHAVLLKGGHLKDAPADVLCVGHDTTILSNDEPFQSDVHGTGCHLSSAIAALLAQGTSLHEAARRARAYLARGVRSADRLPGEAGWGRPIITHCQSRAER